MSNERAPAKTLKAEQSERTRAALMKTARTMFAERGYARTSLEEVARRAAMTTGALYHQYRDKQDLFRAVLDELQVETFERIRERSRARVGPAGRQSWERFAAAAQLALDCFMDPVFCQIVMVDGPAVLGWQAWHRIRVEHMLKHLRQVLEQQMDQGHISREPVEPLAHLLFGALSEAGMLIAHAADKRAARKEIGASALRLFERLKLRNSPRRQKARPHLSWGNSSRGQLA